MFKKKVLNTLSLRLYNRSSWKGNLKQAITNIHNHIKGISKSNKLQQKHI